MLKGAALGHLSHKSRKSNEATEGVAAAARVVAHALASIG
jgi:hypothetical protein